MSFGCCRVALADVWRHSGRKCRRYQVNYWEAWEEQCKADPARMAFRAYYEGKYPELRHLCGRGWLERAWKLEPWCYLTDREEGRL